MAPSYNTMEMMICVAARYLEDGKTVAVGTGAPCAAAMLSQKTQSPNLVILFEAGGISPLLPQMPISVGDSRTFFRAVMAAGMTEMMTTCSRGLVDYAFLGGAQIDKYGNINSTVVGPHHKPKVRFPGSGGACDAGSLASAVIIFIQVGKKRFVKKLDYLTTPGWLTGGDSREKAGYVRGGPLAVVTNKGIMKFDETTKEMYLAEYYPGVSVEDIAARIDFEIDTSRAVRSDPPTWHELLTLREKVDPQRLILG